MTGYGITLRDIYAARRRIAGAARATPLVRSFALSKLSGADIRLKLEVMQETGSFKFRGALNALSLLSDEERARGVVATSTGNHGRGVAAAAEMLGIRAAICMSSMVPQNKIDGIRAHGAEIVIHGKSQDEAEEAAERIVAEEGRVAVPPFDHAGVIAGQGTIGIELMETLPGLDAVIVPLSGGGLIAGIALAVKTISPATRIIGVTMDRGPAMYDSQQAGHPVAVEELPSLADALGGGIGMDNRYTFAMVRDLVDEMLLVSEREIADAMTHLYREERLVVEGSGAVGVAALLRGMPDCAGRKVAVVVSGRNVDMDLFTRVVTGGSITVRTH
ncbi:MAG: hydroxyectoine utilization dehydratase EutB [Rhodospirillales bacterium]